MILFKIPSILRDTFYHMLGPFSITLQTWLTIDHSDTDVNQPLTWHFLQLWLMKFTLPKGIRRDWKVDSHAECMTQNRAVVSTAELSFNVNTFFKWVPTSKSRVTFKTWIRPHLFRPIVFEAIRKATILTPVSVVHQNFPWLIDDGRRRIVAFRIARSPQIRWRGTEGGEFSFLFLSWRWRMSDADIKKKNPEFAPLPFRAIVFAAIGKATILTPATTVYQ